MKKSQAFYGKVLGLRTLQRSKSEVKFDTRSVILSIRPEPAVNLLRSLSEAGRLNGDWIAFHVKDIRAASEALAKEGVKFPRGIEESAHGLVAYFNDPDGHSLSLWQPPSQPAAINYFPQMDRILGQVS